VQLNVWENGKKIATAWAQFATERSPSMYIRMRVLPWSNTLLAGRLGSISAPFVNQPVVLLVTTFGKMEEGKIATAFTVRKKSINVYKNARATLSNTLLVAGWDQFQPFGEPASRFTSAIERSKWKKVR
jgi:hypothetical protein